ncbi:hypothetical protein NDU88_004781 [Pleurodeles waltl]|uniref:Uncharacterized protein n=1 Tax=Pleurodeles waltl TaxID=8319 RepID=A0AAV7MUG5_PLEWA|nr:hypothetical protein NDU88_004781 [Pleurodeles waltl]
MGNVRGLGQFGSRVGILRRPRRPHPAPVPVVLPELRWSAEAAAEGERGCGAVRAASPDVVPESSLRLCGRRLETAADGCSGGGLRRQMMVPPPGRRPSGVCRAVLVVRAPA